MDRAHDRHCNPGCRRSGNEQQLEAYAADSHRSTVPGGPNHESGALVPLFADLGPVTGGNAEITGMGHGPAFPDHVYICDTFYWCGPGLHHRTKRPSRAFNSGGRESPGGCESIFRVFVPLLHYNATRMRCSCRQFGFHLRHFLSLLAHSESEKVRVGRAWACTFRASARRLELGPMCIKLSTGSVTKASTSGLRNLRKTVLPSRSSTVSNCFRNSSSALAPPGCRMGRVDLCTNRVLSTKLLARWRGVARSFEQEAMLSCLRVGGMVRFQVISDGLTWSSPAQALYRLPALGPYLWVCWHARCAHLFCLWFKVQVSLEPLLSRVPCARSSCSIFTLLSYHLQYSMQLGKQRSNMLLLLLW